MSEVLLIRMQGKVDRAAFAISTNEAKAAICSRSLCQRQEDNCQRHRASVSVPAALAAVQVAGVGAATLYYLHPPRSR